MIDDRSPQPLVVGGDEMAAARAGFAKGKHRLLTATAPARQVDWATVLREAADSIGRPAWGEAADLWDVSGSYWRKLSELVAESDPSVAHHVELADQLAANIDSGRPDGQEMATLVSTQRELVEQCEMSSTNAAEVSQALAGNVAMIVDTERAALQRMADST